MNILSIQSHVAYGYVGNTAAVFPLQRLGFDVWAVPTVLFSNHLGYDQARGPVLDPTDLSEVIRGLDELGALASCDAVLSGYLGSAALGEVVLDAVARVRKVNPDVVFCCDPVIGDTEDGIYVRDEIPAFMRERGIPAADIVTPNMFELSYITERRIGSLADAVDAARDLIATGPRLVLVTGRIPPDVEEVEMIAVTETAAWVAATPYVTLPRTVKGTGDLVAALFLAHTLRQATPAEALGATAAAVHGVLLETAESGAGEPRIVAAQDKLVAVADAVTVRRVR